MSEWTTTDTGFRRSYGDGWTATIDAGAHAQVGKWACTLWKGGEDFKQWERTVGGAQRYCDDLHYSLTREARDAELAALREYRDAVEAAGSMGVAVLPRVTRIASTDESEVLVRRVRAARAALAGTR